MSEPAGDLDSVRFDGQGHPWIAGSGAQIWRSTATGEAVTWVDANNGLGADCKLVTRDIDAMVFVPGSAAGYFIARWFGEVWFSSDAAATSAAKKSGDAGNGYEFLRRAVGDPANTNRMWSVVPGNGGTTFVKRTIDGWSTTSDWKIANDDKRTFTNAYDIDYAGGTVLTAGEAGMVLHSIDGENFFFDDADGVIATQNWRAVSLADGANGAIGGTNGKLAVTTAANVIPDTTKPTGTISGPATAPAGRPVAFTLNAADTGGSGLNPASFAWTSAGLPAQGGQSVAYTFPSPGSYTVAVTFADHAGNSETATRSITITKAPAAALPLSFKGPGNELRAKIVGSRIRVRMRGAIKLPARASRSAACKGKLRLIIKKKQRTMADRTAKLRLKRGKCRFAKTISLKRSKVGKTRALRLTVRFRGNAVLKAGSTNRTLIVKK